MLRLFNVYIPTSVVALLVSELCLLTTCYVLAAAWQLQVDLEILLSVYDGLPQIACAVASIVVGMYFQDLYTQFRVKSRIMLVQQVCLALGIAFLLQALMSYLLPQLLLPRWVMVAGSGLALVAVPLWRIFYAGHVLRAIAGQKILFVGTSPVVIEVVEAMDEQPELGLRCLGYVDDGEPDRDLPGGKVLGPIAELRRVVSETQPDRIVVGLTERRQKLPAHELLELRFSGIRIEQAARLFEATFLRVPTRELRPSDLVFSEMLGPQPASVQFQSVYSFLFALILLAVFAPIMIVVALLVKFTSPGPVLYKQVRVGKDDKPFTVMKFRSMRTDAEARTGAVWASKNDPRVTPLGKWLRKLRIDELPQLFCVLKGDMSIVGPRPERPEFTKVLEEKIPFYRQRTCVKPGLTGWAQINHKYGDTIEDTITKLEYDLYYIKNLSFSLDVYVLLSTVKIVLLGRGAQ